MTKYIRWTVRVMVIPENPEGTTYALNVHTSALAVHEARKRVEYIGTHGFWYGVTYLPPRWIHSIVLREAEDVQG